MNEAFLITDTNISSAWARAFLTVTERGGDKIVPLVVTIADLHNGAPLEYDPIRTALDAALKRHVES